MNSKPILKLTLLLCSMMTMMAGAVVAPTLPQIAIAFENVDQIALLSRLIITLPALFIAVASIIFGRLADKIGRRKLLLSSLVLYAFAGVSGFFLDNIYWILVGRAFLGIAVGGIITMVVTLIGDYFKGQERAKFAGLQGAFMGVGGVVFISLAGWFADIHWQMPFLIYLFSVPVFIIAIIYIYEPKVIKQDKQSTALPSYNKNLAFIIYLLAFLGIVFFYMMPIQVPFLLNCFEGVNNTQIGLAIAGSTFASALVSMNYSRIKAKLSFPSIFQLVFLIMGIGYLLIAQADNYTQVVIALFVSGIGTGLLMPSGNLWIMSIAPNQIRGTLVGRLSMATFLGQFFSPILIQPLINQFDLNQTFLIISVVMGTLAIALIAMKTKRTSAKLASNSQH